MNEENFKSKKVCAVREFKKGYNCAQSVLFAFLDDIGLDRKTAGEMAAGFGGGMRIGEVCGAASGALMVIGKKHGFVLDEKQDTYKMIVEFMNRFSEKYGTVLCKDLLGYDYSIPGEQKAAVQSGRTNEVCPRMVAGAVEILEDILSKQLPHS